jgi:glutamate-ammonia-ligase adenylyltransferase
MARMSRSDDDLKDGAVHPLARGALPTRALSRLRNALGEAGRILDDENVTDRVRRVAVASDFAIDTLVRQPALLSKLIADDGATAMQSPLLEPSVRSDWPALLRRYRTAESARLIWRDVLGLDGVDDTLAGSTRLAERCLETALAALEAEFVQRHGVVRDREGREQRLVVFGLGKLGGEELNFSSDVDLVYTYET